MGSGIRWSSRGALWRVLGTWNLGRDVAMVLEEVSMPPSGAGKIVGFAQPAPVGAREHRAAVGGDLHMQLAELLVGVQPLVHQPPGWRNAQPKGEPIVDLHRSSLGRRFPAQQRYAIRRSEP